MLPDGSGVEVVWGEANHQLRQIDGSVQLSQTGISELDFEVTIKERIEKKAQKMKKGNYSGASNVSVCCVLLTPMIQWYFTADEYADCQKGNILDSIAIYRRELFWKALYFEYIETGTFDTIYIVCPTHDKRYVCFDICGYFTNQDWLTILGVRTPLLVPICDIEDAHGEQISHCSSLVWHIINMADGPRNKNLYVNRGKLIKDKFTCLKMECDGRFNMLKANEEELNRIFIDIYGLQDELTPDVADKDVTVHRVFDSKDDVPESMKGSNYVRTMRDEIVSLISYAVGCMFGRYSLDVEGLAYAGGEWDDSKYKTILPDSDNIIPICDDEYFDDDIVGRFVDFVRKVYGEDTLEENLRFVADALGGKGTPREVIRSYFLSDFYADHCKTYQKRPIYWLFDSGKKNGFKALIYMHRYQRDLLARLRTDYVHEQQERYRTQLAQLSDAIDHAAVSERVKLNKLQKKFQDQAAELQKYEEKIHHLADQNIDIDLDDGVKHNYALFADVLAKIK